jgi:hypothetical protein
MLQLAPTDNITEGSFLSNNGASSTLFIEAPPTSGNIPELSSTLLENTSVTGSGDLAYLAFTVESYGNTTINLTGIRLLNSAGQDITTVAPVSKTLVVHLPGDVNGDGVVDIYDAIILASAFGSGPGSPNWNPAADLKSDGIVDIYDAIVLSAHFGQHYP